MEGLILPASSTCHDMLGWLRLLCELRPRIVNAAHTPIRRAISVVMPSSLGQFTGRSSTAPACDRYTHRSILRVLSQCDTAHAYNGCMIYHWLSLTMGTMCTLCSQHSTPRRGTPPRAAGTLDRPAMFCRSRGSSQMHRVRCLTCPAHGAGHAEEGTKRVRHIPTSTCSRDCTEDYPAATTGTRCHGCSLPSLARSEPEHIASARSITRAIQAYSASAMPLDVACRMTKQDTPQRRLFKGIMTSCFSGKERLLPMHRRETPHTGAALSAISECRSWHRMCVQFFVSRDRVCASGVRHQRAVVLLQLATARP